MQTNEILRSLFVGFDINITYITSNKLYIWPTTYLKRSNHNLRLHTYVYIQTITTPRGYHYKIRMKIKKKNDQINKHSQLWMYRDVGMRSSQVFMGYSDVSRSNASRLLGYTTVKLWLARTKRIPLRVLTDFNLLCTLKIN